jgi:hypothetical protein
MQELNTPLADDFPFLVGLAFVTASFMFGAGPVPEAECRGVFFLVFFGDMKCLGENSRQ